MKRLKLRNLTPQRRRQLAIVAAVAVLAVVYLRSRGAAATTTATTSTDPSATTDPFALDGTSPTGPLGSDLFPGGGGSSGGGTPAPAPGTASTGPAPAKQRRSGYRAWLQAHPKATRAERIAALRRLIAHGRGNLGREAGLLAQLGARQGRARANASDAKADAAKKHRRPPPTSPPAIFPHPVIGGGPVVVHGIVHPPVRVVVGAGGRQLVPASAVAVSGHVAPAPPRRRPPAPVKKDTRNRKTRVS